MLRSTGIALACLSGFAILAALWMHVPAWRRFDATALDWIRGQTPDALVAWASVVTVPGDLLVTIPLALALAGILWLRGRGRSALIWGVGFFGGQAVLFALKLGFGRARPHAPDLLVRDFSFPSGHAFTSVVLYGAMLYAGWRWLADAWARWTLVGATGVLIVAVGWSRLLLRVHYPTDVLAGYLLGIVWLALLWLALRYEAARGRHNVLVSSSTRSRR